MNVINSADLGASYQAIFRDEAVVDYPEVDKLERDLGYAVDREKLLRAARVLACPLKVNRPNWQHGRVLYSALRSYLSRDPAPTCILDIGTAKGFSACVMAWALDDAGRGDPILSIDIVEPGLRCRRNSAAEIDPETKQATRFLTIEEFTDPFLDGNRPTFVGGGSGEWLRSAFKRDLHVGFAFVDGKHSFEAVTNETKMITKLQRAGDVVIFDDVNLPQVEAGLRGLFRFYAVKRLEVLPARAYAIAVRK